ncbi:hypothetical protein [Citricoccus sp. NR2]|uniref:hypothetical protein n=1 Tax=Citricoccus sp. NR2 TaxID=3004095 RepID=UPI0022DDA063|nr:hypothetical protein [Citricoccus sp. NR2]WBL19208.1 hypothetical protein O1A05_00425 [Citricoccus sp. NR2]
MDASFWINVAMALIAVIACVFAGISTCKAKEANTLAEKANQTAIESRDISTEANRIAENANRISEKAQERADEVRAAAVWDRAEETLHRLVSFDFASANKDIGELIVTGRFNIMKLAEHIGRPEVSDWLQADWSATAHSIAAVTETPLQLDPQDVPGSILKANQPAHIWVAALLHNIRTMRAHGISPEQAEMLRAKAEKMSEKLRQQFGWERGPSLQDFEEHPEDK